MTMSTCLLWWQQTTVTPGAAEAFAQLKLRLLNALPGLMTAAMVFAVFFIVAWTGQRIIASVAPRVRADTGAVLLLSRIYYYGVLILGLLTALPTTGLNVSALIAGLGLTGFALGFALKDVLSNLLSGIMLLIYRPFQIGDQIELGSYEGTIKMIRMRDTLVRGYDGRLIIIPNTKLITEVVVNNSAAQLVRAAVAIRLAPEADLNTACEVFRQVLEANPALKGRAEPHITINRSDTDGAPQLEGRFWYNPRDTNKTAVRDEVTRAAVRALGEAGIVASAAAVASPGASPGRTSQETEDDVTEARETTHLSGARPEEG